MTLRFLSLSSGSSGNCYWLGSDRYGILIDVGVARTTIEKLLPQYGISVSQIRAIFVTHEHTDHAKAVAAFSERHAVPVYALPCVHEGMDRNFRLKQKVDLASRRKLELEQTVRLPDTELRITPFAVPHDSKGNVGYYIEAGEGDGVVRFCLATDVGEVTDTVRDYVCRADHIVIESNYDAEMLANGTYAPHLKARVAGNKGHMSNEACAAFLSEVYRPGMQHIFLCHLSANNNLPERAYASAEAALRRAGATPGQDVVLETLLRGRPMHQVYELRPGANQ